MNENREKENLVEISNVDNWKMKHELAKKEVEAERDKWKDKFLEADKKLLDESKEKRKLQLEVEEWERQDINKKKYVSPTQQEEEAQKQKQQQLQRFLSRIGGRNRKI